jgi:hypothetical protein
MATIKKVNGSDLLDSSHPDYEFWVPVWCATNRDGRLSATERITKPSTAKIAKDIREERKGIAVWLEI